MKIYLVRQARSVGSAEWLGDDDDLRPLSERGREQAALLADHFAADPPTRIVTAPALRCQQTVQPLASRLGLEAEIDERLGHGEDVARTLELLATAERGPLLLCTFADVIGSILRALELQRVERPECRKASVWTLERERAAPSTATYAEPVRALRRRRRAPSPPRAEGAVRAAVLDLGSTSFNLLIADVAHDGGIARVVREKVMLRLGAVIADEGCIPDPVCDRAGSVAREFAEIARGEEVDRLFAVATAALRSATNGQSAAQRIGAALGHPIRILSGEEEARTIFRAFQSRLELGAERVLGLDLGGGSLELALGSGVEIEGEVTTNLGAVRLHRELVPNDPMKKSELRAIRERVSDELEPHLGLLSPGAGRPAIATGGTARALARLVAGRTKGRAPRERRAAGLCDEISRDELRQLCRLLVRSSHAERLGMRGIRKARADLLPVGAVILETVADRLDLTGYRICDWGLREGILIDELIPL